MTTTGPPVEPSRSPDDVAAEQAHLDRAHVLLVELRTRVGRLAEGLRESASTDVHDATAMRQLRIYERSLELRDVALAFGRIDEEDTGERFHIGRRHVDDERGDPMIVDWRAAVAVPFYRATFRDPQGLRLRRRFTTEGRRITAILDEDFADPDSAHRASGIADPLLAELDRARTGEMREIVATIQAEQDEVIRAPIDEVLIVQGGPGTGKTAVGLHRAALLLYDHRDQLERDGGVLVVGPNPLFLRYIGQVLPSLGETSVVQTTVAGLCSVAVTADDPDEVAALKGDGRMAAIISRGAWGRATPPTHDWHIRTGWGDVRLTAAEVSGTLDRVLAAERGRTVASARERLRVELVKAAHDHLTAKRHDLAVVAPDVRDHLARHSALRRHIDALLPPVTAPALVRRLLGNSGFLDAVSGDLLTDAERRALRRRRGSATSATTFTLGDAVLIDEAEAVLGGSRPRRFGHVVVDEAQDLTPMALRLVRRRVSRFPSVTLLGDLAQASAPGATTSWPDAAAALGAAEGAVHLAVLTTGYRVPGQIIELANRLLDEIGVAVEPTGSARTTPLAPWARFVAQSRDLGAEAAHVAAALASRHRTVGLIAAEADHAAITGALGLSVQLVAGGGEVTLVRPIEAKGLEFDAVVVLEPAGLCDAGRSGLSLLYVAITRAVQELVVVHHRPLPSALTDIAAG